MNILANGENGIGSQRESGWLMALAAVAIMAKRG